MEVHQFIKKVVCIYEFVPLTSNSFVWYMYNLRAESESLYWSMHSKNTYGGSEENNR